MKKLLSLAAIAALTLGTAQANTITITPDSNDVQQITAQGTINAVAIVGGAPIDLAEGGTKFKGLDIDFGTSDPAAIMTEWQTDVPLYVKTNTFGAVTMNLSEYTDLVADTNPDAKIPLEYTFDGVVMAVDGSVEYTLNEGAMNNGQTPIDHVFHVGVPSDYSDYNSFADHYTNSVTVAITAN